MISHTLDDSPITSYHKRLILACSGGPFLDGYLLSIVAVALAGAQRDLHLSSSEIGIAGAVSLVGLFFGSLIFGPVTDHIGRRVMYTADLVLMITASAACLLIHHGWELVVLRFVIGVAVGADYPIATSLLTEWVPKKPRGAIVGLLAAVWLLGAVVANVVAYIFSSVYGQQSWRWMLASGAFFGVIVLFLRMGVHESPRWLIAKGRIREAREHVSTVLGRDITTAEIMTMTADEAPDNKSHLAELFRGEYLRRVAFCGLFWMAFAITQFVLYTDGPMILESFGLEARGSADTLGQIVITGGFLLGSFPGMWLVERIGRRPLILWSFLLATLTIAPLGIWPHAPAWFLMTCFFLFSFVNGAGDILVFIYPNELFPTRMRASAVGVATAISRIGAAIGTYLVPAFVGRIGNANVMLLGGVITLFGFVISYFWAEETRDQSLAAVACSPLIGKQFNHQE